MTPPLSSQTQSLRRYGVLYLGLFGLGLMIGACSAPKVNLKSAALTKLTTTGLNIGLNMNVNNPNSYKIPLRGLSWDLKLWRAAFNNGSINLNRQIAKGNNAVQVPLGIRFRSAALGIQKFASGRNIPWNIGGACSFKSPLGPLKVNYSKGGTWTNPLKGKSIGGIRLGGLEAADEPPGERRASFTVSLNEQPLL